MVLTVFFFFFMVFFESTLIICFVATSNCSGSVRRERKENVFPHSAGAKHATASTLLWA